MLEHKEYLFVTDLCDKLKLKDFCTDEKQVRYIFCKVLEKYMEFKNPATVEEIKKLKAKNKVGRLQRGQIAVDKKALYAHMHTCKSVLKELDTIMKEKEGIDRGKKVAMQQTRFFY